MTEDLYSRVRAAIEETMRIARKACGRDDHAYEGPGEHWRWEYSGHYDDRVDQPVVFDADDEYIAEGAQVSLRSVEGYPTESVGPLPNFVIYSTGELSGAVAAHFMRHDAFSTLRSCEADLRTLDRHSELADRSYGQRQPVCVCCQYDWPCPDFRDRADAYGIDVEGVSDDQ